ncbi:LOW QUALITY PROTEIN: Na+/H+ antiporter NhaC [Geomicrobium sp. JCM 19037]|nr:LOW QUALITY PROTEIN: Na+/H+ antiporter NhaC [Geomicrobium sp. JCM 19037]
MHRTASIRGSFIVLAIILTILSVGILYYGVYPHIPILLAAIVTATYGLIVKQPWQDLEQHMIRAISHGIIPMLILLLIGMLIGVWALNGTIQTMTSYGLNLLSPTFFLAATVVIVAIISTMVGSSLSSIGTVGVSFMGMAYGMDIDPAMTAGAIVSGAIFGDKLSPLSDTTNLAAAYGEVDLFEHIRHMLWTTIPALIITIIIFGLIGFFMYGSQTGDDREIQSMITVLNDEFTIHPVTLLSPAVIILLAICRVKPIPALVFGLVVAGLTTFFTSPGSGLADVMGAAHSGFEPATGNANIDDLLTIGGLEHMLFGVSLIMISLAFGGLIHAVLPTMIKGIQSFLRTRGNTILSTMLSCFGINLVTGEQYLSIILPGQTYKQVYAHHQLHPKNLSRTLEDGGTILHPLVPWGIIGAYVMTTLNVGVDYVFFVFLSLVTPIIALFYAYTGFTLQERDEDDQ